MSVIDVQSDYPSDVETPTTDPDFVDCSKIQFDLAEFIRIVAAIRSTPQTGELQPSVDIEEGSG